MESQWGRDLSAGPGADYAGIHALTGKPIIVCYGDTCNSRPQIDEARSERANRLGDFCEAPERGPFGSGFGSCDEGNAVNLTVSWRAATLPP